MQIRENKILKSIFSALIGLSYLFVVVFSAELHHHEGNFFINTSSEKTIHKSIVKQTIGKNAGDCMACHFLATGHSLLPEEFSFHFENHTNETRQVFSLQEKIWSQIKFSFQLRGPPSLA